jgi:gamma-glutamyltranspeptidase/glutathione hydrolase
MLRQLALLLPLILAACGSVGDVFKSDKEADVAGVTRKFLGAAVGDEPQAVVAARGALNNGGTAADAAVAMYFTLAATLPSSASLGGGGMCIVHDRPGQTTEALDFIARAPATIAPSADRPTAIPGNALGFWLLHARYGKLPWSQLVAPGERLAGLGVPASRVLLSDMAPVVAPLLEDPGSRRVFADATGKPIAEGSTFVQTDLARVLSIIRTRGAVELYRGPLANELVAATLAAGGSLSSQDLLSFKPEWRPTVPLKIGSDVAHFAPPPAAAGLVEAQMMAMLDERGRFDGANGTDRLHALAEASLRAFADRARWMRDDLSSTESLGTTISPATVERLMRTYDARRHTAPSTFSPAPVMRPENPSATSFVIMDSDGSAVACALTMNNNFGIGRMAQGTGIVLAATPSTQGRGPMSLGPMLVVNTNSKQFVFAGAASGGVAAPTALVNVAARALLAAQPLEAAMQAKRIHHGGAPDITYYEPGISRDDVLALSQRGHNVAATPMLGSVNAIHCAEGMPRRPGTCAALADARGNGIALSAGQ